MQVPFCFFEKLGFMHTNKNIYFYIFLNKEPFLFFSLKFWKKNCIFNIGSVSYNVSLQPKY